MEMGLLTTFPAKPVAAKLRRINERAPRPAGFGALSSVGGLFAHRFLRECHEEAR